MKRKIDLVKGEHESENREKESFMMKARKKNQE